MAKTVSRARRLRREGTDAERVLWRQLRSRQLADLKFRRQHPLGPYVVDFVCLERRAVVELDGGQLALDAARDAERTAWPNAEGYRVLRFWNNEVLDNPEGVLARIVAVLGED